MKKPYLRRGSSGFRYRGCDIRRGGNIFGLPAELEYKGKNMFRIRAHWFVLGVSIVFVLLSLYGYLFFADFLRTSNLTKARDILPEILPIATLILTSLSTLSAISLGWRVDRRQKRIRAKNKGIGIKKLKSLN
jgi:hypothetical protein